MKKIIATLVCLVCCDVIAAQQVLTLQQLKDSALNRNIAMRQSQLDIDAAREQRREALTKYFPQVSATGAWFNANRGMAKMDIDPQEFISPELGMMMAQSLPPEILATIGAPMSMTMMKNGTIGALTAMQPVFAGGQIVNGNSLLANIHKDVGVAVRAGVAMRNDLLQVELRRGDIESQRLKLKNGISIVRLLLAQYCGLHESEELRVKSEEFASAVDSSPETGAEANSSLFTLHSSLQSLPEYQLLEKQVEATALQKKMAVGQLLPSVAIGAGYNYHNLLDNDRTFAMVFATVSVPISDWWGGSHAVKRKKLEHQKALDQLSDNAQLLNIRMQKAANDVGEARQQLDIARRAIEQAEENLRIVRNQYKAGVCSMSDLLEAQLLYQQTLDKRVDAWAELQNRLLDLRQATGKP